MKKAAENTRITLKSIETLTYSCTDTSLLLQLNSQLTENLENFRQHLPSSEGLIIRPGAITRALKTKRKYRQIKASKIPLSKKKEDEIGGIITELGERLTV